MTVLSTTPTSDVTRPRGRSRSRLVPAAAAAGAVPVIALCQLQGETGAQITAGLEDDVVPLSVGAILAVLVAAGLFVAAVRLGRRVPGEAGALIVVAGSAVALMYGAYYSVFGAGGVVATQMLSDPSPALGEAASLSLNVMEITRYAPGLVLVAAAVAARRQLPRWVVWTAGGALVLAVVPVTSWAAAVLIPVWLGVSAAVVDGEPAQVTSPVATSAT